MFLPVKSKAQARKFGLLYAEGKISRDQLREWVGGVDYDRLPKHVKPNRAAGRGMKRRKK